MRLNDHVIFESVKTKLQYLHCGTKPLPAGHIKERQLELNLSVSASSFVLVGHAGAESVERTDLLLVGLRSRKKMLQKVKRK